MQDEKIDPFLDDLCGKVFNQCAEVSRFDQVQWQFATDAGQPYFNDFSINQDQLGPTFAIFLTAMYVNRFVFIGVEKNNQPEVFVKLRH